MKHATIVLLVFLLEILSAPLMAQDYRISFQSGPVPSSGFYEAGILPEGDGLFARSTFMGGHYLILQFRAIPTPAELQALRDSGVELFDYIPNYAYLARVPVNIGLHTLGVRAACAYEAAYKLAGGLASGEYPGHAYEDGQLQVRLHPWPTVPADSLRAALVAEGFRPGAPDGGTLPISLPDSLLLQLAAHPGIRYVSLPEPLPEPDGIAGRSSLRLNLLSDGFGAGLDGAGVSIAIGDDGTVSHEDFRGRLVDHTYGNFGDHGDMTAGLAIGAGNIDPRGIGMAPGATLHLYNIGGYPQIADALPNYQQYGAIITSTSYSEGCGGAYTASASEIDWQVRQQPELLHVFSAGNSAAYACSPRYGGLAAPGGYRYGNITGGRKAAKNVLAVANLYYNGLRVNSSSRGPAEDGRIKPDISAYGQGAFTTAPGNTYQQGSGTSAAAPSVAGAAAALVQAYRQQNDGADPSSALIKASILNTAEDLGRPGPDYDHGWGRLHAGRALEVIQQRQYFTGVVGNGGQNTHLLDIPGGVKEARVMLYWIDPEGAPVAARALVNDLDLTATAPNGATFRPWVLSSHPHIDSLTRPAYRGADRINNVEQVVLENPSAGAYSIKVRGFLLGQGPQQYYVVYSFLRDEITVTYPAGGEHFTPGETEAVRWDAYGNDGAFTLQYSVNGGSSWITVSSAISGSRRSYSWLVPDIATGQARIRILRNGQAGQSPGDFNILGVPDFQVGPGLAGTVHLSWAPVPGANQYDVYVLGQYTMEIAASTSSNFASLPAVAGQGQWYSVRARMGSQATGQRAVAKYYTYYPCETEVTLTLHFDNYPGETHWQISTPAGEVLAAGGPYSNQPIGSAIAIQECLPYGCFDITVFDSYQNGMCCNYGNGYYELRDENGALLAGGGQFGSSETRRFCLSNNNAPLQASIINVSPARCSGGQDGSATASASGGTGNYTYLWSHGATTPTAANLSPGNYSVTVSDGQSYVQAAVSITAPPPISLLANATSASCSGAPDGAAFAQASGGQPPYRYLWSHGANTQLASGLAPGSYTVTVTDQNNCSVSRTVTVSTATPLTVVLSASDATCQGAANGEITANASGGAPPYSYHWSTGATGALLDGLPAGTYEVEGRDVTGCIATAQVQVGEPAPLQIQVATGIAPGGNSWAVSLNTTGGTPPYGYDWQNGITTASASGLEPGSYAVTATDAAGCTAQASFILADIAQPSCNARAASADYEWIEGLQFGDFFFASGNNGGHGDFRTTDSLLITAQAGMAYGVTLIPGFHGASFYEYWRLWIDLNQDGDFLDEGEEMLAPPLSSDTIFSTITLPDSLLPGEYSLRVAIKYGSIPLPCTDFPFGEVEDYKLLIEAGTALYCNSGSQSSRSEWIEEVRIGNMANLSGNDGGYADYTDRIITATPGEVVSFSLKQGNNGAPYPESWRIWADLNQDGDFEDAGELLHSRQAAPPEYSGSFLLPATMLPGLTRLRVSMKFGTPPGPCEPFTWGETEDYTLSTADGERSGLQPRGSNLRIPAAAEAPVFYPNPTGGKLFTRFYLPEKGPIRIGLYTAAGKLCTWQELEPEAGWLDIPLETANLPPGAYYVHFSTEQGSWASPVQVVR